MVNGIASGCISTFWKICLFLENVVRMVCESSWEPGKSILQHQVRSKHF